MLLRLLLALVVSGGSNVLGEEIPKDDYAAKYHDSMRDGKPLIILVGKPFCFGCDVMKCVLPKVMGKLQRNANLSVVDYRSPNGSVVRKGDVFPQTIIYYKVNGVWYYETFVGAKDEEFVYKKLESLPK